MTRVVALVLAAGEGRRMGGPNKLLAEIGGVSIVRRVALAALESRANEVIVVVGHRQSAIRSALAGLPLSFVQNDDYAAGLSTSLRTGVAALGADADGVLVLLADMPFVNREIIDRVVEAFAASDRQGIVAPVHGGRRGNPVLWPRRFFAALIAIEGDKGARDIMAAHAAEVIEVEAGPAVALDIDTAQALAEAGGRIRS